MRSDLKVNTNTINKMIQFGTVKYGIVKQLKDRSRSERDVSSDQEENGTSMPCSPIVECSKSASPILQQQTTTNIILNTSNSNHQNSDEDHNHNNNNNLITTPTSVESLLNNNNNINNNNNNNSSNHQLLYPNSPIKQQSTELVVDTTTTPIETATILPSSYPELEKINDKTPSPALAEQNRIADQPQSPLVDRLTGSIPLTTIGGTIETTTINQNDCSSMGDDDDQYHQQPNPELDNKSTKNNDSVERIIDQSNEKLLLTDNKTNLDNKNDDVDDKLPIENNSSTNEQTVSLATTAANNDSVVTQNDTNCNSPPLQMPQFPAGPVTLEAIQNMQMAIAQFAAKTFANGGGEANEAAMKQLAFLQQTLFNLQQQQLFQIQLIQQLQSQLALNQMKSGEDGGTDDDDDDDGEARNENGEENRSKSGCGENGDNDNQNLDDIKKLNTNLLNNELGNLNKRRKSNEKLDMDMKSLDGENDDFDDDDFDDDKDCMIEFKKFRPDEPLEYGEIRPPYLDPRLTQKGSNLSSYPKQDENMPLPYGSDLASSIITNHDDSPSSNCLEMLQKRTQEVLDSASQGILSGNLADDFAFGKDRNGDGKNRNEPFFKHRCRYCGKVFGSDSALQIHIRSHTGERPFKCNVCGSRFTTKGNLKVHFQRHAQKFPHVPMNSTPIPEHLDKFHPPLLEQMSPESSPPHQPQIPNVPVSLPLSFPPGAGFPGLQSLYRPPLDILKSLGPYPNPFFNGLPGMPPHLQQQQQKQQEENQKQKEHEQKDELQKQNLEQQKEQQQKEEQRKKDEEMPTDLRKASTPNSPNKSKDDVIKNESEIIKIKEEKCDDDDDDVEEQIPPKRPRSKTPPSHSLPPPPPTSLASLSQQQQHQPYHIQQSPLQPLMAMPHHHPELSHPSAHLYPQFNRDDLHDHHRIPLNFRISPERRSPNRSPASIASSIPRSPFLSQMKHEMALLPRPHSNDNSWENFIEVSNTSETLKLKELMKNKKLTDPNQCVVCDRVLSCKSALQMHYRTHTGERPFKCRICGRAFTTKGNLKTHMAVHKIRPPMRNFHQCPVCHKKYSNALVLQQHIRLHTGEPTDLTPDQIAAAEIRDFPPSMMPGSFLNPFAFNFGMGGGPQNGHMGSESSLGELDDNMDCSDDFDDDISEPDMLNGSDFPDRPKSRDDIKGMLFEQKLKLDSNRPKSEASNSSVTTSPVSPIVVQNKSSPLPSDTGSQGALDLTPRAVAPVPQPQQQQTQQQKIAEQQQKEQQKQIQELQEQQEQHQKQLQQHHQQLQQQLHLQSQQQPPATAASMQQLPSQQNHAINHMMAQRPPFGMFPNIPLFPPPVSSATHNMCSAMNSIAQSVMPSAPFNPLALSGVRGSTTCGICFKTFPCHSALEIHYRSHTKERPFKCTICDRGFTTKGNLKQHMLTHKIRDMEQDAFRNRAIKFEYMRNLKEDFE